jgi:hypothetical protein
MNNDWIYYGVFFSQQMKDFLIERAKDIVDIPEDWKLYGDHMTIIFNDGTEEKNNQAKALDNVLGRKQNLKITSIGISDEAIAFAVGNYATQNEHSHITIAVAPGSKPVKSNEIKNWTPIIGFYVTGKIGKISKKK